MRPRAIFPLALSRCARLRLTVAGALLTGSLLGGVAPGAAAQPIDLRQWQGVTALTRQPGHVLASTLAEWRSLWSRIGMPAPEHFEQGRMNAVGIFLGARNGNGFSVNLLSASRRRDRIVIVFEERAPRELMAVQRAPPRPVASAPNLGPGGSSFAPSGIPSANLAAPPGGRPPGQQTSPWAVILINRADLPVSVEQRLFR